MLLSLGHDSLHYRDRRSASSKTPRVHQLSCSAILCSLGQPGPVRSAASRRLRSSAPDRPRLSLHWPSIFKEKASCRAVPARIDASPSLRLLGFVIFFGSLLSCRSIGWLLVCWSGFAFSFPSHTVFSMLDSCALLREGFPPAASASLLGPYLPPVATPY